MYIAAFIVFILIKLKTEGQTVYKKPNKVTKLKSKFSLILD